MSKLALVPQNLLCSYTNKDKELAAHNGIFDSGNFIVSFANCDYSGRNCAKEMAPWFSGLHGIEL